MQLQLFEPINAIQRFNLKLSQLREENLNYKEPKGCCQGNLQIYGPSVYGLGPYSGPLVQFFSIRTSRPANNIVLYYY